MRKSLCSILFISLLSLPGLASGQRPFCQVDLGVAAFQKTEQWAKEQVSSQGGMFRDATVSQVTNVKAYYAAPNKVSQTLPIEVYEARTTVDLITPPRITFAVVKMNISTEAGTCRVLDIEITKTDLSDWD